MKPGLNEVEGLTYFSLPSSVQKSGFHELQSAWSLRTMYSHIFLYSARDYHMMSFTVIVTRVQPPLAGCVAWFASLHHIIKMADNECWVSEISAFARFKGQESKIPLNMLLVTMKCSVCVPGWNCDSECPTAKEQRKPQGCPYWQYSYGWHLKIQLPWILLNSLGT